MVMPRYQRRGIGIAGMPAVSTVGLQEAARTSQTLASALDRVSGFALKQAAQQAKIEGAEFGALNTPTLDEIKTKGQAALPGDKATIYGQAAREQALAGVLTRFEMEANSQITELRVQLANEEIDAEGFREKLQALNAGLSGTLATVDPSAANELRKAIQTTGNASYLTALAKEQEMLRKDMEVLAEVRMRELVDGIEGQINPIIEDIVAAGDTVGPDGKTISIDEKIEDIILPQLQRMSLELSDPEFYSKYADKVRQKISEAKVNIVVETITEDTLNMLEDDELDQERSFEDKPQIQAIYKALSSDERKAVRDQVDAFVDEKYRNQDAELVREEKARAKKILDTSIAIYQAIDSDDEQQIETLIAAMSRLDPDKARSWEKVASAGGATADDIDFVQTLNVEMTNGRMTVFRLNKALTDNLITRDTYDSMFSRFSAMTDKRYGQGKRYLKNAIGYPEYDSIAMGPVQRTAVRDLAALENEYLALKQDALSNGQQPPDPFTWFKEKADAASLYDPAQREADLEVITEQFNFNDFENYGQMRARANRMFQDGNIEEDDYARLEEAFTNFQKYNMEYGEFQQ